MITHKRTGGRAIELFVPFEHNGVKVKEIVIAPVRLDHTLRWQTGDYKSILALLAELSGLDEQALRQMTYPDTDRVMAVFIDMLPPEIKDNIANMPGQETSDDADEPDATKPIDTMVNGKLGRELMPGEPSPPDQQLRDETGLGLDLDDGR